MKVLTVKFVTSGTGVLAAQAYSYLYDGKADVEVGDFVVANNALASVVKVYKDKEEYELTPGALALSDLKAIKHVLSLKAEREEAARQKRIAEIKSTLHELKDKVELRRALEGAADSIGQEGKKLMAELRTLEGDL